MYFGQRNKIIAILLSLLFLIASITGWQMIHQAILLPALAVIMSLSTTILIDNHCWHQFQSQETQKSYRQIESLFYLFSTLKFRHPLPPMRGWAISPDFANSLISLIRERKPRLVVEIGSGVSTLVTAYCLQEIGDGTVISLDHDEQFSAISAENIVKHQLQDTATVIYAPLKEVVIQNKSWLWYDTAQLQNLERHIDMLIIDGPPTGTQKLARYPALPILIDQLSDDSIILLDDAARPDERQIVKLWQEEFPGFAREDIDAEKGITILRWARSHVLAERS